MKGKHILVTAITALLLFALGFWFLPGLLVQLTKSVIESDLAASTRELSTFVWANAFLLAACAPAAAALLWAYSRKRPGWPRVYGFFLCLLVAIVSAATGISLRLLVFANQLRWIGELGIATEIVAIGNLRYSQWGCGTLVVVCGAITIVLLVLSQQREEVVEET